MDASFVKHLAAKRGTELHALAAEAIRLGVKLQGKGTLALYVNDAIGYRMSPEQILFYSPNCFGTADAISFRRNTLRIHDLKTGASAPSEKQLETYAAIFCLEYRRKPSEINMDLRFYYNNEILAVETTPDSIFHIMDRIITYDRRIDAIREEMDL